MRNFVFQIFVRLFATVVLAGMIFIATVVIRGGLTVLYNFSTRGLPVIGEKLFSDPWYIVALVLAVLLVWSWPWEEGSGERLPVRRGRVVSDYARLPNRAPGNRRGAGTAASKIRR